MMVVSMISSIGIALGELAMGLMADWLGIVGATIAAGAILVLTGVFGKLLYSRADKLSRQDGYSGPRL